MERAGSSGCSRLSMMLGHGVALKGCATRPGKPASALDRDAVAKQLAVIPFMAEWASAAEFRLNRAPSCEAL
jgi:hypothetical protein